MMRKLLNIVFSFVIFCIFVSCSSTSQLSYSTDCLSFGDKLKEIKGVSSVTEIQQDIPIFREKYIVTFTQPIDWKDPSKGSFEQRVEIGFQGYDSICFYNINGYCLYDYYLGSDIIFKKDDRDDLCTKYNGNLINIEYRFYGESVPDGLSSEEIYLWDNLTEENAAKDFYSITEKLSSVLYGKKLITGHSKGGYSVNAMSYFFPESFDAFVSFVAPLCNGPEDSRLLSAVYKMIESDENHKVLLDFSVFCLENRDELEDLFYRLAIDNDCRFRKTLTKEILWDLSVLDFMVSYIQYDANLNDLYEILQLPDSSEEEHKQKMNMVMQTVNEWSLADGWNVDSFVFPYLWQSFVEMGQYSYVFNPLRDFVISATGKDLLTFKEDMGAEVFKTLLFTEEQQKLLVYDDSMYKALLSWSQTTESNVIMIFGEYDPWYSVRIPKTYNDNIHEYCVENGCHDVFLSDLNEEDYTNCVELLNKWLF